MAKTLQNLHRTVAGSFAARIIDLGAPGETEDREDLGLGIDPLLRVQLDMPLSDARRFGGLLYEWIEIIVPPGHCSGKPKTWETLNKACKDTLGFDAVSIALACLSEALDPENSEDGDAEIVNVLADIIGCSGDTHSRSAATGILLHLDKAGYAIRPKGDASAFTSGDG